MPQSRTLLFIKGLLLVVLAIGCGFALWLSIVPYNTFVDLVINLTGKATWRDYFMHKLLTPARFVVLPYLGWGGVILYGVGLVYVWKKLPALAQLSKVFLLWVLAESRTTFKSFFTAQHWLVLSLMGLALLRSLVYILAYDLQYDEAWTYTHFTHAGMMVSALSPHNNHAFYSIVAAAFDYLPLPAMWTMRLPVLIAGLWALMVFTRFLKTHFSETALLIGFAYLAFTPPMAFYMLYARGYMFSVLFTVLMLVPLYTQNLSREQRLLMICSAILNVYSLPTQIYPVLLILGLYLVQYRGRVWKDMLAIGVCIGVLYTPALLTGAMTISSKALNTYESARHLAGLWKANWQAWDFVFGGCYGVYVWLLALAVTLGLLFKRPADKALHFILIALLLPSLITLLQGAIMPARVWTWEIVPLALLLGILAERLLQHYKHLVVVLSLSLAGVNFALAQQDDFLNWSAQLDHDCRHGSETLLAATSGGRVYNNFYYIKPALEYHALISKRDLHIFMADPTSLDFAFFHPEDAYDAIVWDAEEPAFHSPLPYQEVFSCSYFKVYVLG